MIDNLNLYNTVSGNSTFANNTAATQKTNATEDSSLNNANNETTKKVTTNNVYLSSRSQKISDISQEFFSGGELTFDDIERLKGKLYQYGLISKNEYTNLTGANEAIEQKGPSEKTSTSSITNFIGNFVERLNTDNNGNKTDKDDSADETETPATENKLIQTYSEALKTAKNIFENVEKMKQQDDFKSSLKESMLVIKGMVNDENFTSLSLDDQVGVSQIYKALEIVDTLSPQRLSNAKINQYIESSLR